MFKPTEPKALHLAASNTSTTPTLNTLTPAEAYLVNCFRQLQDDAQELLAETCAVMATDPDSRRHTEPSLHLVRGGTR